MNHVLTPTTLKKLNTTTDEIFHLLKSQAFVKMQEYKTEMEPYEAKYHMPFERFEKMIEREKEENFEHWDDFIIWEGLYEGFEMWRTKYQVLKEYV